MTKDLKKTNLIYKVVDGELRVLGVMANTELAKKYVEDLNNTPFSLDGEFVSESICVFEDNIPFELIQKTMDKKPIVLKYVEVVGTADFSEITIKGVSDYSVVPDDYQDSDDKYHVFFEVSDEEIGSPTLNSDLIRSFCEVVSEYKSMDDYDYNKLCEVEAEKLISQIYEEGDYDSADDMITSSEGYLDDVVFRKDGNRFVVKDVNELNEFLCSIGIPEGVAIFK